MTPKANCLILVHPEYRGIWPGEHEKNIPINEHYGGNLTRAILEANSLRILVLAIVGRQSRIGHLEELANKTGGFDILDNALGDPDRFLPYVKDKYGLRPKDLHAIVGGAYHASYGGCVEGFTHRAFERYAGGFWHDLNPTRQMAKVPGAFARIEPLICVGERGADGRFGPVEAERSYSFLNLTIP